MLDFRGDFCTRLQEQVCPTDSVPCSDHLQVGLGATQLLNHEVQGSLLFLVPDVQVSRILLEQHLDHILTRLHDSQMISTAEVPIASLVVNSCLN